MAATALPVASLTDAGVALAPANADNVNGNSFPNQGGDTFLYCANTSGAPITLTFTTPLTHVGLAVADRVVTVANNETRLMGPFDTAVYNGADGLVIVTPSAGGATVKLQAFRRA